jgi:hypothetical protein
MNALSTVERVLTQSTRSHTPSPEVVGTLNQAEEVHPRTRLICGNFEMEVT